MAAPCALVTSCCSVNPSDIIKQILGTEELPEATPITDGIVGYPWRVENKYYAAQVQLCSTPSKTIGNADFSKRLEAVIIVFDDTNSSFESVKQWMPFINQLSPSTQILACRQFTLNGEVSQHTAQLWCLDHSFELVELERGEDEGEDDEDEYDITGVKRVISALHAHSWSNLELKERRGLFGLLQSELLSANRQHSNGHSSSQTNAVELTPEPDTHTQPTPDTVTSAPDSRLTGNGLDSADSKTATTSEDTNHSVEGNETHAGATSSSNEDNLLNDDMELFRALGSEDPDGESFEGLFSRMAAMKETAAGLSGEERKKYAEKVAVSFWKALGGDKEEVDGLEDSD